MPYLLQGGLGLPDRDYYVAAGAADGRHPRRVSRPRRDLLKLAGIDRPGRARRGASSISRRRIANAHATRTESVDVTKANNPWTRDEFGRRAPGLDWTASSRRPVSIARRRSSSGTRRRSGASRRSCSEPIDAWRDYLTFHEHRSLRGVLPKAFADERFAFYGKALSGTPQQRDRWKRAVDCDQRRARRCCRQAVRAALFPAGREGAARRRWSTNIVAAFDRRIDALTWMSPKTQGRAPRRSSATLKVGIGYPGHVARLLGARDRARTTRSATRERAELFDYQSQPREARAAGRSRASGG